MDGTAGRVGEGGVDIDRKSGNARNQGHLIRGGIQITRIVVVTGEACFHDLEGVDGERRRRRRGERNR